MTKHLLIFILCAYTLSGCDKSNLIYSADPNYPTVIKKLDSNTLSGLKTSYAQKNKYLTSSLNEFGFCHPDETNNSVDSPPLLNMPTQPEAIEIVKSFVLQNSAFTGIKNPATITFSDIFESSNYWDGASSLVLKTANQRIDTMEVMYTQIIFHLKSRELVYCADNCYPDIYIPNKFNINQKDAKTSLLNKVVWHSTIAGVPYSATITAASLAASTIHLVVLPITINDQIELRVAWQINFPGPVYYLIYVDVMTGEVIGEQPTIIS